MRLALALSAALLCLPAQAQIMYFLVDQWHDAGNQFCKYSNGTVLNVGARHCPLHI